eukprot:3268699-Prymnesium_polylepis.1
MCISGGLLTWNSAFHFVKRGCEALRLSLSRRKEKGGGRSGPVPRGQTPDGQRQQGGPTQSST